MNHRSPRLISYTVESRRQHVGVDSDQAGQSRRYAPISVAEARAAIQAYETRRFVDAIEEEAREYEARGEHAFAQMLRNADAVPGR